MNRRAFIASLRARLYERVVLRLFDLPLAMIERLVGPPVTIDGQTPDARTRLLCHLAARAAGNDITSLDDIEALRSERDSISPFLSMPPDPNIGVEDITIPQGTGGERNRARIFRPAGVEYPPVLVYFHGGGWVIGSIDSHHRVCAQIARDTASLVISVNYRRAPEHPFPEPVDDALAAYQWACQYAAAFGGDPTRVAVGGDSAGANLAAVLCLRCREQGIPQPLLQWLVYPSVDQTLSCESHVTFADGFFLTRERIHWFRRLYLPDVSHHDHPHASPLHADDLSGLAPAYVVTAGLDPLRDEGLAYAERLRAAGVDTVASNYPGFIHGFLSMTAIFPHVRPAVADILQVVHDFLWVKERPQR